MKTKGRWWNILSKFLDNRALKKSRHIDTSGELMTLAEPLTASLMFTVSSTACLLIAFHGVNTLSAPPRPVKARTLDQQP